MQPYSDSVDYHRLAAHLASGRGFVLGLPGALYPTVFRPPLLPAIVAPFYALFGARYVVALLVQIAVSALTVPLVYGLARRTRVPSIALPAAIAIAVWPVLVFFSTVLLTETLEAFLVVAAILLAVELMRRGGNRRALAAGLALGLAALARPTALPLAAALAVWIALAPRRPTRARLGEAASLLLGVGLLVAPWTLRNAAVTGAFVPVTAGGGAALFDGNNREVVDDPRWRGGARSLRAEEPYASSFRGMNEVEIDRASAARAWAFLRANPELWPKLAAWKLARFFRPRAETSVTGTGMASGAVAVPLARALDPVLLTYGLLLPFFLWGWVRNLARLREPDAALGIAVLVQSLLAVAYWGSLRMRAPVEPLIVVLGLQGVADVLRALGLRR